MCIFRYFIVVSGCLYAKCLLTRMEIGIVELLLLSWAKTIVTIIWCWVIFGVFDKDKGILHCQPSF